MANQFALITYRGTGGAPAPYIDDRGTPRDLLARFSVPPGVTAATITTIIGETNGLPRDPLTDNIVCPDSGFTPRKLIFYSAEGGSIGVPIGDRTNLIAAATVIRGALIADGFNVVCIKLEGEKFKNLVDELRPAGFLGFQPSTTSSRPAAGGKQPHFFGKANYASDAIFGDPYILPYKFASQAAQIFPAVFAPLTPLTLGITPLAGLSACPGTDPRKSRRYIVQSQVTENAIIRTQTTELPVFLHEDAAIQAAGVGIATIRSTQCIGYAGEDNSRFHRLL